jgi:hypothetical protein
LYIWDGNGDRFDPESEQDEGLVYMRCEVFVREPRERLAYIVFLVEIEDGEYLQDIFDLGVVLSAMSFDADNLDIRR